MENSKMNADNDSSEDWTALCSAVILQRPILILNLLKQNVNFRCTDENGNTVLHMVFKKKTFNHNQPVIIEILNIFLDNGMDPNIMNNEGKTALHLAVKSRLCGVIDFLIRKGANLNIRDQDGDSIAHFLVDNEFDQYCGTCWLKYYFPGEKEDAQKKSRNFVRWLISKGLLVNYRNVDGLIPLHLAAQLNLQIIMLELLDYTRKYHVNYVNGNNQNILHSLFYSFTKTAPLGFKNEKKSISMPFREEKTVLSNITKLLLEKGVSVDAVDENKNTPFHLALKLQENDITNILIEKFTNVNACDSDGNTVLHIILMNLIDYNSCIYNNYVEILLSRGANIHIKNNNGLVPLQIAVLKQRANIVHLLKKYNANFQVLHENGNLLHFFTMNSLSHMNKTNSTTAINLLVSEGCDVNSRNAFGKTPLHLALRSCNVYVVDRLIELGADMKAQELYQHKYTTLHLAVMHGYEDHLNRFIKAGVDVNVQDGDGRTPLHLASKNFKILKKLLRLGAFVDKYDSEGNSPLHMAIRNENYECVIALLHHGADINDVNTRTEIQSLIMKKRIANVIIQHWMKLKNACLPVSESSRDWNTYYQMNGSSFHYESLRFREECTTELQKMKNRKIVDNVTWYDFLHMNRNRQCGFVKTNDIRKQLYDFPIYQSVIVGAYNQAKSRMPLLRPAINAWYELTNYYLPDICVEQIYSYLGNAILRDIIMSVQNST